MTDTSANTPISRASGLLLHPTSLPGGHGVGDLGPEAYRFVDLLVEAGQSLWQIMPLGPPGYGESPYAARSAFAGNPLLISLDRLVADGLLDADDLEGAPRATDRVDFAAVEAFKTERLRRAYGRLRNSDTLTAFRRRAGWVDEFALFMALRDAHDGAVWTNWPRELVQRDKDALADARREHGEAIAYHVFVQWLFHEQWGALRRHANAHGVRIVGDVPIFVAHDSADVWAHQDIFHLDEDGEPTLVAGVPPDAFSATGQRWGNPLYHWEVLAGTGFEWWVERFRATLAQVDVVRIDHFRGFQASWQIPAEEETAQHGRWVETPGQELFATVRAGLGDFPVIAEDLGLITPPVRRLRQELGFPGMAVLQFAFGDRANNPYLPHNHTRDSAVYTGTHDNDTTVGWYSGLDERTRDHVRRYLSTDGTFIAWTLIHAALASVAATAIIPVQDVLSLGGEARMNLPGHALGNWSWRLLPNQFDAAHAARLHALTELCGRLPGQYDRDDEDASDTSESDR